MCERLACTQSLEEISKACTYITKDADGNAYTHTEVPLLDLPHVYKPKYNIWPVSAVVPVLIDAYHFRNTHKVDSKYAIGPMTWGIIPDDDDSITYYTHNAWIEHEVKSEFYKFEYTSGRRCLILCDGFFAWSNVCTNKLQPYYIYQEKKSSDEVYEDWIGKPIMKLAGFFRCSSPYDNRHHYSFTIITKTADKRLSWLCDRTPIILDTFKDAEAWLDHNNSSDSTYQFLMNYEKNENNSNDIYSLKWHAVDRQYVESQNCNSELTIKKVDVSYQTALTNWVIQEK